MIARSVKPTLACALTNDRSIFRQSTRSWKSLRTTNPIESIVASVGLRTDAARRLRTGASATYLLFKLIQRLSTGWRRINGYRTLTVETAQAA